MVQKYKIKTKPEGYQVDAIKFILEHENIPLFDEQGLGKSKIIIDALCHELKQKRIDGAIIICNKTLAFNWENEISKHSTLTSTTILGGPGHRTTGMFTNAEFYIINYEAVISELDRLRDLMRWKKFAIVLDESQKIKNPFSKVTQAVLQLRNYAKKRIIATGTPIANHPEDLWSQFFFLDNGVLLGTDFSKFENRYKLNPRDDPADSAHRFKELQELIGTMALRRQKSDVLKLPEKVFETQKITLEPQQREMYNQLKKKLYIEIVNEHNARVRDESKAIFKKLLRLVQITSNPRLFDFSYKETPAKFKKLDLLIKKIVKKKEKVIVWTSFVDNIRILRKRYEKYGTLVIYGEQTMSERKKAVESFQEDSHYRVLIANPSAAKAGLTLIAANNAIYLDRSFKLDDYLQSQDRIHRFGQTKNCRIVILEAKDSVDEYIDHILDVKHDVARFIQKDSVSLARRSKALTKEEILEILS